MTTVKLLVLVIVTFLLLAKGKGVEGLDHELPGGEELLPGLEGFEGRQFSSLVGGAPWLQGARHLLSIFGQTRFDVKRCATEIYASIIIWMQYPPLSPASYSIFRRGRQHSVVGTILTTLMQLLGFDERQLGSRALDVVRAQHDDDGSLARTQDDEKHDDDGSLEHLSIFSTIR